MRTDDFMRRICLLPIAALGLGCSATGGPGRWANEPTIRTIASIGDRPVTAVAGVPTDSAAADLDTASPSRDRGTRVSGRVVDHRGDPVAGAKVRVADGGVSGGRVAEATTDRAGGFTLHGLRPGSRYTLIAETEGQGGTVEGRSEARPPATGVEIAVQAADAPTDHRRAGRSPSGRKVSERRPIDEPSPAPKANQEDLPAGSDAEEGDDLAGASPTSRRGTAMTASRSSWRSSRVRLQSGEATASSALDDAETRRASNRPASVPDDEPAPPVGEEDDEGANPLPPAIEPGPKRGKGAAEDPGPGPTAARPRTTRRVSKADPIRPGPTPGALALAEDVAIPPRPEPAPRAPAEAALMPTAASADAPAFEPFPPTRKQATWADLATAWEGDPPAREAPKPNKSKSKSKTKAVAATVELCRYDARRLQVLDFRLPDLAGGPVSLKDIDADFILLDFWGTWCRPCLSSVPHLVELQKRMGVKSLAVVGIACEDGPASANAAHVADVAKGLGVNYTILLSSKDESASPMQEALHIQAFPTLVLLDRNGRIVWRGQGATTATLVSLDRVIAASVKSAGDGRVRR